MRRVRAIVLLLAAAGLVAASSGCANPGGSDGGYYRRGTVHQDAFPRVRAGPLRPLQLRPPRLVENRAPARTPSRCGLPASVIPPAGR